MAANTTKKLVPCLCSSFEFGDFDPDSAIDNTYNTGCAEATSKVFAMGHDAKLAGYLTRAELAGDEIRFTEGGMAVSTDAIGAARRVSEAFTWKVVAQLNAAKARLAKKAAKEADKVARKSAKTAERKAIEVEAPVKLEPIRAMIKVGRWTYEATIDRDTREATYRSKLNAQIRRAQTGEYTIL